MSLYLCVPMLLEHAKFLWNSDTNMLNFDISSILTWNPCLSITILNEMHRCRELRLWKIIQQIIFPTVKSYLAAQQLSHKVLLLVDNATCHADCQFCPDKNIVIKFLQLNTTSILQPVDQGVCKLPLQITFTWEEVVWLLLKPGIKFQDQHYSKHGIRCSVFTTKESAADGESNGSSEAEVSHSLLPQELETALTEWCK